MKTTKKILSIIITLIIITAAVPAFASGEIIIPIYLDGVRVDFGRTNNRQDNAIILYDYAYVPIAKIIDILTGQPPHWNDAEKTATFNFNNKHYAINTRENGIYVDNRFIPSATGTPPVIVNDRTLIPLRMLSNVMGFGQNWNEATRSTYLTSPIATVPPAPRPPVNPPVTPVPPIAVLPPTILKLETSDTSIVGGQSVVLTVTTNSLADAVKVTDLRNRTLRETKSFRPSGTSRIFELDFMPADSGTYRVFPGSGTKYETTGQDVLVTVSAAVVPIIHSAAFSASEIHAGSSVELNIITSQNVTSLSYSITQGGGVLQHFTQNTGFSDNMSTGTRTFTNTYTAPAWAGEVRITITATTVTSTTATTELRGTIKLLAQNVTIYDIQHGLAPGEAAYPGDRQSTLAVLTGLDANRVTMAYNGQTYEAVLIQTADTTRKYWAISFRTSLVNNLQATITSQNTASLQNTASQIIVIPIAREPR